MPADPPPGPRPLAVVTGASSGIGEAFSRELADRGHDLCLIARDDAAVRTLAAQLPTDAHGLAADLSVPDDLDRVARHLQARAGSVSVLVNNAATGGFGDVVGQDPAVLDATVLVNVLAVVRLTRAVLPAMLAAGRGGVIAVSSPAGSASVPGLAAYGASKAFVDAFTRSLRAEVEGSGVVVTSVWPGWTRTRFHDRLGQDVTAVPAGEWQSPAEVVRAALDGHARGEARVELPAPGPLQRLQRLARVADVELRAPWPDRWKPRPLRGAGR